jgi:RNA polymerase sigma-70 factor (ECF subfamily)
MIAAARLGDRAAQAALLRQLQDVWYRVGLRLLGNGEAAREATQETALRFLKELPRFEGRSGIRTWAVGIAINVAREMRREGRRQEQIEIEAAAPEGEPRRELEERERAEMVNRVVDGLPMRQREAVVLRFFEELSIAQTAEAMQCAEGTVKALVFQALRTMRGKLRGERQMRP